MTIIWEKRKREKQLSLWDKGVHNLGGAWYNSREWGRVFEGVRNKTYTSHLGEEWLIPQSGVVLFPLLTLHQAYKFNSIPIPYPSQCLTKHTRD